MLRSLQPMEANVMKRLVKSPKVYVRDSGLLLALLDVRSTQQLAGHPVAGALWEGVVIEQLITAPRYDDLNKPARCGRAW